MVASNMAAIDESAAVLAKLKPKQRAFVKAYLESWDGKKYHITNAAIAAGYSAKTAYSAGSRLLKNVEILNAINAALRPGEVAAICDIQERKIILSEVARGKASDYLFSGKDGSFISYGSDSPNQRAVAGITTKTASGQTEEGEEGEKGKKASADDTIIQKLEMRDAIKAIDVLNKMDGVYTQKVEVSGSDDLLAALAGLDGAAKGPPAARASK